MRLRSLLAAGLALACLSGLAACRTNVGAAAVVDGHRISESDVAKYLTPSAQTIPLVDNNGNPTGQTVAARTWVLRTLVRERLLADILSHTKSGPPSEAAITDAKNGLADAATLQRFAQEYLKRGYRPEFSTLVLREDSLEQIASTQLQDDPSLEPVVTRLSSKVSLNPRYGTWDAKSSDITGTSLAVPSYLTLKPNYVAPNPNASVSAAQPAQSG